MRYSPVSFDGGRPQPLRDHCMCQGRHLSEPSVALDPLWTLSTMVLSHFLSFLEPDCLLNVLHGGFSFVVVQSLRSRPTRTHMCQHKGQHHQVCDAKFSLRERTLARRGNDGANIKELSITCRRDEHEFFLVEIDIQQAFSFWDHT